MKMNKILLNPKQSLNFVRSHFQSFLRSKAKHGLPSRQLYDESYVFLVFLLLNLANWPSIFIYDLQFLSLLKIIQPQYLFGVDTCSISGKKYQINLDGFQSALRV